jgi:hypothetical protein
LKGNNKVATYGDFVDDNTLTFKKGNSKMRDKFGFRDSFVILDDSNLSDQLYIQFTPQLDDILIVIDQPECDVPSFIFDVNQICTMAYIQKWFRNHNLYEHQKTIELYYPKINETEKIKVTRENLDRLFGVSFLKDDQVDNNYIANLKYIQS